MFSLFTVCKSAHRQLMSTFICALLLTAGIMWSASPLRAATQIDVPAGDSGALLDAIRTANQSSEVTVIRLNNSADYRFNLSTAAPEPISGHIIIEGEGAHLVGEGIQSYGPLFVVSKQGILDLSDLVVRDFESGEDDSLENQDGLITVRSSGMLIGRDLRFEHIRARSINTISGGVIQNNGQLDFDRVRIVDVSITAPGSISSIAIHNGGIAQLQNLLIVDGKYFDPASATSIGAYIRNIGNGQLELRYSSLILESEPSGSPNRVLALSGGGALAVLPESTITGTMIVGMECPDASIHTSGGFNLFTDDACYFSGSSDLVGVSPGELQFRLGGDGGLEVVLSRRSRALDGVKSPNFDCPGRDAIGSTRPQDGNQDGNARCDIGAFENSGGGQLFAGGENGLFYSADVDGHYVTIQEVRPNEYVVIWNTFDLTGNQAWILALGHRDEDVITTEAYFLPIGMLIPGSGADVDTGALQSWGTVEIRLLSCLTGEFRYVSELAEFGSGSFDLDRLGFVEGLGCQD